MSAGIVHIDYTHMARRHSGIERITRELFNEEALAGVPVRYFSAPSGRSAIALCQQVGLPFSAMVNPKDVFVFPGYPPSPLMRWMRQRSVVYVHDLFLLTRRQDLNSTGKFYMAPSFSAAVRGLRYFLVNSQTTAHSLRAVAARDAEIRLYRPHVRNVFNLAMGDRPQRPIHPSALRLAAIGTIEPRKNFLAAADIRDALASRLGRPVELHVVGRPAWGGDADALRNRANVLLHGALADAEVAPLLQSADFLICTSHDEGLGLPLLEAQHGGLPIIAPDKPIFREVLGTSGIFIDPADPTAASDIIARACANPDWRQQTALAATDNLRQWNNRADDDRAETVAFLRALLSRAAG